MNIICKLFGHKQSKVCDGKGFNVCPRCNLHELNDASWYSITVQADYYDKAAILIAPFQNLILWIKKKYRIYKRQNILEPCFHCDKEAPLKEWWKNDKCPNCGMEDLPF